VCVNTQKLFADADEIAEVLRFHLVQGTLNERGNYGTLFFITLVCTRFC
jgi:hypothetical protein